MACCKCCCGGEDCASGQEGKCCCGGSGGVCCQPGEYCCSGECQPEPCGCSGSCDEENPCQEGCLCCDGVCQECCLSEDCPEGEFCCDGVCVSCGTACECLSEGALIGAGDTFDPADEALAIDLRDANNAALADFVTMLESNGWDCISTSESTYYLNGDGNWQVDLPAISAICCGALDWDVYIGNGFYACVPLP